MSRCARSQTVFFIFSISWFWDGFKNSYQKTKSRFRTQIQLLAPLHPDLDEVTKQPSGMWPSVLLISFMQMCGRDNASLLATTNGNWTGWAWNVFEQRFSNVNLARPEIWEPAFEVADLLLKQNCLVGRSSRISSHHPIAMLSRPVIDSWLVKLPK